MTNSGKISWRSPSNIALVKYWGKKGVQLPGNPSVGMTLSGCFTETSIEFKKNGEKNDLTFRFYFDDQIHIHFEKRLKDFLALAGKQLPSIRSLHLIINSKNSFPHSAGIASSASAFSSLALCLCSIDRKLSGKSIPDEEFFRKASFLARLGSGSSCRSVYGGWTLWGETAGIENSSDNYAIPVSRLVHKNFLTYYDAILLVNSEEKPISSSKGHRLMRSNPYREVRTDTGKKNTLKLLHALTQGNEKIFRDVVESEAASLHAMFLTSRPYYILIKPETLHILNLLKIFRKETGLEFSFTLDAGPNIHLLYGDDIRSRMLSFIRSELLQYCEKGKWIDDKLGSGPEMIEN